MLIVEWSPIIKTEIIPPFGVQLSTHLHNYHDSVKYASCSAWNLLYRTLKDNMLPIPMVSFTETGKPIFVNSDLHFSLSHSRGVCAVAISEEPIGVDVEICRGDYNPRLVERSLCIEERQCFDGDFTHIWCKKEALAKMTGEGITGYPNRIRTIGTFTFFENKFEYNSNEYWICAVKQIMKSSDTGEIFKNCYE